LQILESIEVGFVLVLVIEYENEDDDEDEWKTCRSSLFFSSA